jgi:TRAP-type C4-dicarboxylate transport system permease small subunit
MLAKLDQIVQRVEWLGALVGAVAIFATMWIGVFEIGLRKIFNSPLYGQLDMIEQTMVAYAILPVAYCYRKAGHIRVDILVGHLTGRRKWISEWLASLAALVLVLAIFPGVYHYFENAYSIGDSTIDTQWPTWPSKFTAVAGFLVLAARLFLDLWAYTRLVINPEAEQVAVPVSDHQIEAE